MNEVVNSPVAQTNFSLFSSLSIGNVVLGAFGIGFGVVVTRFAFYIQHNLLPASFILPTAINNRVDPSFGTTLYRWLGIIIALIGFFTLIGFIDLGGAAFGGGSSRNRAGQTIIDQTNNGGSIAE